MANKNLNKAKEAKKDEFYTQLEDINNELRHYREHFRGKTVLCNCDDPRVSNFFKYFAYNFEFLGLKKLIATCYKNQDVNLFSEGTSEQAVYLIYEGDKNGNNIPDDEEIEVLPLKGDGDFRSPECIEFLKEANIIVTNPPFSLFREYVAQLIKYDKKFLIIGSYNAIKYKEIFPLIKSNNLWLGIGFNAGNAYFKVPEPGIYAGTTVRDSVLKPACISSNFAVKIGLWTKWNFTGRFFNPSRPYALEANNHVRFLPTVGITELSKIKCVRY